MPTGKLSFILRTAQDALPINSASVTVTDELGSTVFYEFLTAASSGISRQAELSAPPKALSLDSSDTVRPYSVYSVFIRAEGNYRMQINGIQMFEGTVTRLPVELIPLPAGASSPEDAEIIIIRIPEHILTNPQPPAVPTGIALPAVNILGGVYIPETVTVHLGTPDEEARNVTLPFIDYIKNVASSEVYPTWPKEALRANIIAQISLTLNRIYTEWYPSQGYSFDITNTTAFDQAFVYGRNIFDEMSEIVDELFNNYLVRPNSIEPVFAAYCDGTATVCAGLSQWGTVALAEDGRGYEEILGFYYGDVEITETDDIRTPEESYPGSPLSLGSEGENVRIIQEQLNRISVNFPRLPLVEVDSIYGEKTEESVRSFQNLFVLPITGIVDRATWYRISRIYSSVKRLAELTSEGQRAAYNQQLYPGAPLRLNSRGSEVQEIQFYLQRIAKFNSTVEAPVLDGIFGSGTQRAVQSFQRSYGLTPNGIIDEADWNRLTEVYNGTLDNVDEPKPSANTVPYPGYDLKRGIQGEYVLYLQRTLNYISNVFLIIPKLEEDSIFGPATENAVNIFAGLFALPQNGTATPEIWAKMNEMYLTVRSECIFAAGEGEGTEPFPGAEITVGAAGENVIYIQEKINRISNALPYIRALAVDGRFGAATEESVKRLQRVFGLTANGRANESTWLLINYIFLAAQNGCLSQALPDAAVFAQAEIEIGISDLKELMRQNGINVGLGPLFGLKSRTALADWQRENGLEPTGLPNAETRQKLKKKQAKGR